MNTTEYLLSCLAEECCEVGQRVSKALRFSLGEVQPTQDLDNADRIRAEYIDLLAVMEILVEKGIIQRVSDLDRPAIDAKKAKVQKYLDYAVSIGAVVDVEELKARLKTAISNAAWDAQNAREAAELSSRENW